MNRRLWSPLDTGGGGPKLKSLQDRQKLPMYEAAPERWVLKGKSESEYPVEGDKCLLSVVNCWHTEGESGFWVAIFLKEDIYLIFFWWNLLICKFPLSQFLFKTHVKDLETSTSSTKPSLPPLDSQIVPSFPFYSTPTFLPSALCVTHPGSPWHLVLFQLLPVFPEKYGISHQRALDLNPSSVTH